MNPEADGQKDSPSSGSAVTSTEIIEWRNFLEAAAPGEKRSVRRVASQTPSLSGGGPWLLERPDLLIFCEFEKCDRKQFFTTVDKISIALAEGDQTVVLNYICRNCLKTPKLFAIHLISRAGNEAEVIKLGELPAFGDPLPAKLQRLVQPQRALLLKGWQSENRGFGIGAFAYYRRLVEDEKNRLIDELIKTCDNITGADVYRENLKKAREEIQFTKAIEQIGEGIPDALHINGQNPLTLLHHALSRDLHQASDEECLVAAQAIRIVLMELSERMSLIRKENSELRSAMTRLFGQRGKETEPAK